MYEEKRNFAGKVNEIAKILVRTEAFLKEKDNIQCGLEEMKESNGNWTFWITVVIAIGIIGFAAVIFTLWKLYKHMERRDEYYLSAECDQRL